MEGTSKRVGLLNPDSCEPKLEGVEGSPQTLTGKGPLEPALTHWGSSPIEGACLPG